MSAPEQIIADFIKYNRPYINEIKETNSELDAAIKDVLNELTIKFLGTEPKKTKEGKIEQPMNQYNVGDMVETLSGKWDGTAKVKSVKYDPAQIGFVYEVDKDGKKLFDLEENIFTLTELEEVVEETEYSEMSDQELQEKLEEQKEYLELLDEEEDEGEIEETTQNIDALEIEIERRKTS